MMTFNGLSEEVRYIGKYIKSTFGFSGLKSRNLIEKGNNKFPALFEGIYHILNAAYRCFEGSDHCSLCNTIGTAGYLALHLITGSRDPVRCTHVSHSPAGHCKGF